MISIYWIILLLLTTFYTVLHVLIWYCVRYRGFFDEYEDGADIRPPVSILINSKNEEGHILSCLKSIEAQDYPKENIEVIIIDESTDKTPQIIQDYMKNHDAHGMNVNLIRPETSAPPNVNSLVYCLKIGMENASHDIYVYTEADCTPHKKWLMSLLYPLAEPKIGFSGTHCIISGKSLVSILQRLEFSGLLFEYNAGIDNIRRFIKMGGVAWAGSLAFKKEAYERVNGYKGIEHIHIHEVALCGKFARKGYESRFMFNGEAKVETAPHPHPIKQRLRWFRGMWQCREYKFHIATFGTYLLPLIFESAAFLTIAVSFFITVPIEDINSAILVLFISVIIKYTTLYQFSTSPILLKGCRLSAAAVILYYFWLFLVQCLYFISIFTRPKTTWREEEPIKKETTSIQH